MIPTKVAAYSILSFVLHNSTQLSQTLLLAVLFKKACSSLASSFFVVVVVVALTIPLPVSVSVSVSLAAATLVDPN